MNDILNPIAHYIALLRSDDESDIVESRQLAAASGTLRRNLTPAPDRDRGMRQGIQTHVAAIRALPDAADTAKQLATRRAQLKRICADISALEKRERETTDAIGALTNVARDHEFARECIESMMAQSVAGALAARAELESIGITPRGLRHLE